MLEEDDSPFKYLRNKKLKPKDYTVEMKVWFGNQLNDKKSTIKELTKIYGLNASTAKNYAAFARQGLVPQMSSGRPMRIDDNQLESLQNPIKNATNKLENAHGRQKVVNCLPDEIYQRALLKSACLSQESRGRSNVALPISRKTRFLLQKRLKAHKTTNAQQKTTARTREMQDPRNFFVEACILEGFAKNLSSHCEVNLDATQLAMGKDGIVQKVWFIKDEDKEAITRDGTKLDDMGFYMKAFNTISKGLHAAPVVVLISDGSVSEDSFWVKPVIG